MSVATRPRLTLEEYLNYDDGTDRRYELVDGVLIEMPTESTLNTLIVAFLVAQFLRYGLPYYRLGLKHRLVVDSKVVTAREPDLLIHSEASFAAIEGASQACLKAEHPVPLLVVEVVSPGQPGENNYDRDYIEKRQEYAARGIPEYWLVDPQRKTVRVLLLAQDHYEEQCFQGDDRVISLAFPEWTLTADEILQAGR